MTYQQLLDHFGTHGAIAAAFNVSPASVSEWKGCVPPLRQVQGERLTRGKLKADPGVYDIPGERARTSAS